MTLMDARTDRVYKVIEVMKDAAFWIWGLLRTVKYTWRIPLLSAEQFW